MTQALLAQEPERADLHPPPKTEELIKAPATLSELDEMGSMLPLSLAEALRWASRSNVNLAAREILQQQASLETLVARAFFEPELFGAAGFRQSERARVNTFQPEIRSQTFDAELGWRQRVVTGGLLELAYRPTTIGQTTSEPGFPGRQYLSEYVASYTQPLLRGAWSDAALADSKGSELRAIRARQDFTRAVEDTIFATVQAYWELVFARENYTVVVQALQFAERQLASTMERIRVGEFAPLDRVADEAEVANRREQVLTARFEIDTRADNLRRLLFDDRDGRSWSRGLLPTESVDATSRPTPDWREVARRALFDRQDLAALRSSVAEADTEQARLERNILPQLDLVTSYSSDGISDQFRSAHNDAIDLETPDWSVRILFSQPIGNLAARAQRDRGSLEVERRRREVHVLELDVLQEVRFAVRELNRLEASIRASAESVRLARTNLETEELRLDAGSTTAFEVQRRNQELQEARSRYLRNQLDYRVAEARLLYAQGDLSELTGNDRQ